MENGLMRGSMTLLILKLLEDQDRYGYQMIEELRRRSNNVFRLKAGTLYPILHGMEEKEWISAYKCEAENGKSRRYYHMTDMGRLMLKRKTEEWNTYSNAVTDVLTGAESLNG